MSYQLSAKSIRSGLRISQRGITLSLAHQTINTTINTTASSGVRVS
jgi:hypothetical protein